VDDDDGRAVFRVDGPLRSLLAIATVSLVALAPFALLDPSGVIRGAVAPALATLVAFVFRST
jgi:hypothetical protein